MNLDDGLQVHCAKIPKESFLDSSDSDWKE